jgi:hypothetical protein
MATETTEMRKTLRWRLITKSTAARPWYDLWYGNHERGERVAEVRWSSERRTYYFKNVGGRNSLLAGERFASVDACKDAARKWIKGEIAAGRM